MHQRRKKVCHAVVSAQWSALASCLLATRRPHCCRHQARHLSPTRRLNLSQQVCRRSLRLQQLLRNRRGVGAYRSGTVVETSSAGNGGILGLPRLVWLMTLPVLILLAVYLGYQGVRARRARKAQPTRLNRRMDAKDSRLFALTDPDEDLKPLVKHKAKTGHFELQMDAELEDNDAQTAQSPLPNPRHATDRGRNGEPQDVMHDDEANFRALVWLWAMTTPPIGWPKQLSSRSLVTLSA